MSSQAWGLLSAWTCTPAQRCLVTQSGRSRMRESKRGLKKKEEEGRRRTVGCGKMPSAHSLKRPHPAFQRLCTCKCLSEAFAQWNVNVFFFFLFLTSGSSSLSMRRLPNNSSYYSIIWFASSDCTSLGSCSTTLSSHSVTAVKDNWVGLCTGHSSQPSNGRHTHRKQDSTHSHKCYQKRPWKKECPVQKTCSGQRTFNIKCKIIRADDFMCTQGNWLKRINKSKKKS